MKPQQELEKLAQQIITGTEAAEVLGCSVQRFHQLIEPYGLATVKKSRNVVLFLRKQVEALAKEDRPGGRPTEAKAE